MQTSLSDLYRNRLGRYTAAMRNEQPDCVPIRPFVAEFTSVDAGYTCQQTAHDDRLGFDAALKTAQAHDWDAVVPNMIATWTGMTQALGLNLKGWKGVAGLRPGKCWPAERWPSLDNPCAQRFRTVLVAVGSDVQDFEQAET
jgi:hypothetical protein